MGCSKFPAYLEALRAPFFTASIVPILLGAAFAWFRTGQFNATLFVLTLLGGILCQAGANVANDYFDHRSSDDVINKEFARPFTGGSRVIQRGLLTAKQMFFYAMFLFLFGSLIGVYLVYRSGYGLLLLGFFGIFTGYFYTAPPIALVNRGVGEIVIGLDFGVFMTLGAFYIQTGYFTWECLLVSLPVAVLIALVVFINQFQDMKADAAVGKNHWVVRIGRARAAKWYAFALVCAYVLIVVMVILHIAPVMSLLPLLTIPFAFKAIKTTLIHFDNLKQLVPANATTIIMHASVGILLTFSFILDILIT